MWRKINIEWDRECCWGEVYVILTAVSREGFPERVLCGKHIREVRE